MTLFDSHIQCENKPEADAALAALLRSKNIEQAILFARAEDIYDSSDYYFQDSPEWQARRESANLHIKKSADKLSCAPFLYVWNDFRADMLDAFKGVAWMRHPDDPVYDYTSPDCEAFLQELYRRSLPLILMESADETMDLLRRINGRIPVIIPYLGNFNGGFRKLFESGAWDIPNVYANTALASLDELYQFVFKIGAERLLFGSGYPDGDIAREADDIISLEIDDRLKEKILFTNCDFLIG